MKPSGVITAASMSARKLSHKTSAAIASSGSPLSDNAERRRARQKTQAAPWHRSRESLLTTEIRMARNGSQYFEVPLYQVLAHFGSPLICGFGVQ